MKLREGQQVVIKNPRALLGTVVRQRPGDADLPEDERRYEVRIQEESQFYLLHDLEPVAEDEEDLRPYSRKWMEQLQRWTEAGQQLYRNADDETARRNFIDAGHALGFMVSKPSR